MSRTIDVTLSLAPGARRETDRTRKPARRELAAPQKAALTTPTTDDWLAVVRR